MSNQNFQSNQGVPPGAGNVEADQYTNSFNNQYGEPSSNLQNINKDSSNAGTANVDVIPIDNSIQHYELPNLTQCKLQHK